jgi:hypothetical protein
MAAASPGAAPAIVGCCDRCGAAAPRADAQWLAAFGVALCGNCRRADGLVSKSKAKVRQGCASGARGGKAQTPRLAPSRTLPPSPTTLPASPCTC